MAASGGGHACRTHKNHYPKITPAPRFRLLLLEHPYSSILNRILFLASPYSLTLARVLLCSSPFLPLPRHWVIFSAAMDLSIILTYRCNSRCSMCHVWQHPTLPAEEISPTVLAKLPGGFRRITLTGGEPSLRADLDDLFGVLRPKARRLEILTNGLQGEKLEAVARRHPDVTFRISIDGIGARNDSIRGERSGFERKRDTLRRLAAVGAPVGFATVLQDENCDQIVDLFRLCASCRGDLSAAALHNGFQFFKADNEPTNRVRIARAVQPLITEMLRSRRPGDWFRACLNLGLMRKILGQPRRVPCRAGRGFAVIDPWGRVYACPVRPDLEMGDLAAQSWRDIMKSPRAAEARTRVARCTHNCWWPGPAGDDLRSSWTFSLPRWETLHWMLANRLRTLLGRPVDFDRFVDYRDVAQPPITPKRESWLGRPFRPTHLRRTEQPYGMYNNVMNK